MEDNWQFSIKLTAEELVSGMNEFDVVTQSPNGSPVKINNCRGDSNNIARRENEDNITTLDDGNEQCSQKNVCRELDVDEKHMNDLQEILNSVVELVSHSINENIPSTTINLLRKLSTSIGQKMYDLIDTCKKSVADNERTAKIPTTNVGVKRVRDVDECTVEDYSIFKKPKTEHEYNKYNERSATTSSLMEQNTLAAKKSIENYLKRRKTSEPRDTITTDNRYTQKKKFEYSKIVVNELKPYYLTNNFATKELFQFMAKSIVHRLLDTDDFRVEYTIKSKIKKIMSKTKIESEEQILKLLKEFF